jgi:sRNA-binding protein
MARPPGTDEPPLCCAAIPSWSPQTKAAAAAAAKRAKARAAAKKAAAKAKAEAKGKAAKGRAKAAAASGAVVAAEAPDPDAPAPAPPRADGPRGTLLVVPLSVLSNWTTQLEVRAGGRRRCLRTRRAPA